MGWWNRMVARAWRDDPQGSDDIEAAVMPRTGRVVIMSSIGNEVISKEKASAVFAAVTLRLEQLARDKPFPPPAQTPAQLPAELD